ncbi:FUSC family protein [Curtobacterium sp. VKM Ac-2887]|uniref:FUSC family protein n=1 Tax=Curtobacterium sp. VKM Ac-2887 TaxID=2783819 RepID=UPI00188BE057|nr:hypothetical protein [Curtobacterium sp. VKM Ac-2887]MBF4585705.1 hypothetical protein [Curtobacterium sp. VKM Ac-2887]
MTDEMQSAKPARPKGSPAMIVLMVIIVVPTLFLAEAAGAGAASIIGGFIAMFSLIATMGGPLRADLRRLAFVGPLVALGAIGPRLLAEVSRPGAIALITVLIFAAGLLPLRARRYEAVALGIGMGTLFGYAMPINGAVDGWQLVIAGAVGVAVAALLRVLFGAKDPSGPTRSAIAAIVDGSSTDVPGALDTLLSDRPTVWLGRTVAAAGRYRLARRTLEAHRTGPHQDELDTFLGECDDRSALIASAIRAKVPDDETDAALRSATTIHTPAGAPALVARSADQVVAALSEMVTTVVDRDTTRADVPKGFHTRLAAGAVRAGLRHGSVQVRHAFRTALAVLIVLLVSLFLRAGDPLVPTLLMTTFSLIQVSWGATLGKARDRLLGIVAGGVIVVLVVIALPPALLLPISIAGLLVGMWFITARPAVGVAGILVMSVGINTELRHLQPMEVIVEYVVLTAIAVLVASVIGFVVVPAWRPKDIPARIDDATSSTAAALAALAADVTSDARVRRTDLLGDAHAATQQLVPDQEKLSDQQRRDLDALRAGLQDVLATALFVSATDVDDGRAALDRASDALAGNIPEQSDGADGAPMDDAVEVLAEDVHGRAERARAAFADQR